MAEGETPPPPESPKGPEKEFTPSWLIKTKEEFDNLRGGMAGDIGKMMAMMHQIGFVNTLDADEISERIEKWGREASREGDETMEATIPYFAAMNERVQNMRGEKAKDIKAKLDESFPSSADVRKRVADVVGGAVLAEGFDAFQAVGKRVFDLKGKPGLGNVDKKVAEVLSRRKREERQQREVNPSGQSPEGKKYSEMTYGQLRSLLRLKPGDPSLPSREVKAIKDEMNKLLTEIVDFEDGDFLDRASVRALTTVRTSSWDNVYNELIKVGDGLEQELKALTSDNPRWAGILRHVFASEAARVVLGGIESKKNTSSGSLDNKWLEDHGYSNGRLERREEEANNSPFNLLPDKPEELVGKDVAKVDSGYLTAAESQKNAEEAEEMQRFLAQMQKGESSSLEDRYVPIQAPDHVGAVFRGGLFEKMFRHPTIPILEIRKKADRETFILENIHAFDYIFNSPGQWLGALESWIKDTYFSARQAIEADQGKVEGFKDVDRESLINELKAVMAVTASARAMEKSNGSLEAYGVWLTTGGQGKEADLDVQDQLKDKILHEEGEEKRKLVLKNDKVRGYYLRLIQDMGIKDRDEKTGLLEYELSVRSIREKRNNANSVVYYLSDSANTKKEKDTNGNLVKDATGKIIEHQGGFVGYMEDVLLRGVDKNSKNWDTEWAAARIATDLVLTDGTFTRWEWDITGGKAGEVALARYMAAEAQKAYYNTRGLTAEQKKQLTEDYDYWNKEAQTEDPKLKLFPIMNWGGDPLRSILEPTFLPRKIKSAYRDNPVGQAALDDLDSAFAPYDIYNSANLDWKQRNPDREPGMTDEEYQKKRVLTRSRHQIKVSMTENWKKIARWSRPEFAAMGGSQAEMLGVWNKDTATNMMQQMLLMNQVVGGTTEKHKNGKTYPVGKHELGANIARTLKAKAKAYVSQRPGIFVGGVQARLLDPRNHPNYEALSTLLGADLTGNTGLIREMNSSPAGPIFRGNWFGAEQDMATAIRILETNNPNA